MSLIIDEKNLALAKSGHVFSNADAIKIIKTSLPKAWALVEGLIRKLNEGDDSPDTEAPPGEDRNQLLRMCASTSMRKTVEEYVKNITGVPVALGFQNCGGCKISRMDTNAGRTAHQNYTSFEAQVLAQSPQKVDC